MGGAEYCWPYPAVPEYKMGVPPHWRGTVGCGVLDNWVVDHPPPHQGVPVHLYAVNLWHFGGGGEAAKIPGYHAIVVTGGNIV